MGSEGEDATLSGLACVQSAGLLSRGGTGDEHLEPLLLIPRFLQASEVIGLLGVSTNAFPTTELLC